MKQLSMQGDYWSGHLCLILIIKLVSDDWGFWQELQRGSFSYKGDLVSGLRFCGRGTRTCTCGLGAGLNINHVAW